MIIKLKTEFTKKCSNLNKLLLFKYINIFFILIYIALAGSVKANECKSQMPLKVGLLDNKFIDYKYYLYYELGNYALKNSIEFNIEIVDKNIDEFDIIFGEYDELINFPKIKLITLQK